jgi:hypothetical protein
MNPITVHRTPLPEPLEERLRELVAQLELPPARSDQDDPPTYGDEGGGYLYADQKRVRP